jgi:hypothetical protein
VLTDYLFFSNWKSAVIDTTMPVNGGENGLIDALQQVHLERRIPKTIVKRDQ